MKAYVRALEREQKAWRALDGHLPGTAGCSPALWSEWLDATAELNVEIARYTHMAPTPSYGQRHDFYGKNGQSKAAASRPSRKSG